MKTSLASFLLFPLIWSLCTFALPTTQSTTSSSYEFPSPRTEFGTAASTPLPSILGAQSTETPAYIVPLTVMASVTPTTSTPLRSDQTSVQGSSSSSMTSPQAVSTSTAVPAQTTSATKSAGRRQTIDPKMHTVTFMMMAALGFRYVV